jgi:hypothetical protein
MSGSYCCDYLSGRPMWRAETSAWSERCSLLVEGDCIYVCAGGTLDSFDALGQRRWALPLLAATKTSPAMGFPGNVAKPDQA